MSEPLVSELLQRLEQGDQRALARVISLVENSTSLGKEILLALKPNQIPVIGVTGPPGAGKSTLINQLVNHLSKNLNKKVGVIAVDPTSPFNLGSILGDRIRMNEHYDNPNVFIRSLATRGSLGGVTASSVEIVDVMKSADFDYIIVETVGVGQSEVEIAGLADTTLVVMVPEAGDEIQIIKSGLMEIADIFVVNKADRPNANDFVRNLKSLVNDKMTEEWIIPVHQTVASKGEGISDLIDLLEKHRNVFLKRDRHIHLLVEKAYRLIALNKMKDISRKDLFKNLERKSSEEGFNLYRFVEDYS